MIISEKKNFQRIFAIINLDHLNSPRKDILTA